MAAAALGSQAIINIYGQNWVSGLQEMRNATKKRVQGHQHTYI